MYFFPEQNAEGRIWKKRGTRRELKNQALHN
jgi:hypothetical protein